MNIQNRKSVLYCMLCVIGAISVPVLLHATTREPSAVDSDNDVCRNANPCTSSCTKSRASKSIYCRDGSAPGTCYIDTNGQAENVELFTDSGNCSGSPGSCSCSTVTSESLGTELRFLAKSGPPNTEV